MAPMRALICVAVALALAAGAAAVDPYSVNLHVMVDAAAGTEGDIVFTIDPSKAPRGAERFKEAVEAGVYDNARFFRAIEGFMVQFGIPGEPAVAKEWKEKRIEDDEVVDSNTRGTISFATSGPNSRTTQCFINLVDNSRLDGMGFAPFATVTQGMDVVDSLYMGYGEGAPRGRGPAQNRIQFEGNEYLSKDFPKLSYIIKATVVGGSNDL
eukprot:CAMPEP_0203807690 /NCGR_PEP_ID=MMETSP0115-20131106/1204_1 /ASSEMBLY_ACC=CAM_ASM_000227 /TAXON_ID=33651 /ORGANISM="Bicosoecid sp, Strain ms1" /LENGTH=210 /DNA_ID=CAMNT_0050716373 /DNA_START=64 /DNA_END=696 /DNA_ORIENTATION=+